MSFIATAAGTLFLLILMKLKILKFSGRALVVAALVIYIGFQLLLLVPMQYYSPAGELRVMRNAVQIVPRVPGQITAVHVKSQDKVRPGQPLFNIDPRDYITEVRRLEGALADAEMRAALVDEQVHAAEATLELSRQQLSAAEAQYTSATQEKYNRASAAQKAARANSMMADREMERQRALFTDKVVSAQDYDKARQAQAVAINEQRAVEADQAAAQIDISSGQNQVDSAKQRVFVAESLLKQAQINNNATSNGVTPLVAQATAQLEAAKLKLDWTTVTAEISGTALNVQLEPGQQVGILPVMVIQDDARTQFQVAIGQPIVRNVQLGDPAEMFFDYYPGKHYRAHVSLIGEGVQEGQLTPSGRLVSSNDLNKKQSPIIVRLEPEDKGLAKILPTGAGGVGAIYCRRGPATHPIRMIIERMRSWWKFVWP